jgi:alkanesulfonate monooxygenase SsuD/methylene tetrahydromethanopterin reductase-like flavin-dependent oxidoreductase (luciferase family)
MTVEFIGVTHHRHASDIHPPANEGTRCLVTAAAQCERLDKRMRTGAALLTGPRRNTISLGRTPHKVVEALPSYYTLGGTAFLIRDSDLQDDAIDYGRHLLSLMKRLTAERAATRVAA